MQNQDPSNLLQIDENSFSQDKATWEDQEQSIPLPYENYNDMMAPPDGFENVEPQKDLTEEWNSSEATPENLKPLPIQLPKRLVSGTYIGNAGGYRMELRVDVDGTTKLNRISFDFFQIGASVSYWGSFQVASPTISTTSTTITINGAINLKSRALGATRLRITIPRRNILQINAPAVLTFFIGNTTGAVYNCAFNTSYFRTVRLETDVETGTALAGDYNTASLPNPGPNRVLNVVKAFQEAGVNMVYTGRNNFINTSEAGADSRWTDAEMHASMVRHFSAFRNVPQWAVWLFAARRATSDSLLGIMFDYTGAAPQRQGAAVFQDSIRSRHSGSDYNRLLLFTYVHELGHAFNLLHSWNKERPDSLSWMNYPWGYDNRNGAGRFWANFAFRFDQGELQHLRHGFYNNVIMGGSNWNVGAGLEHNHNNDSISQQILENNTGLALEISPVKTSYKLGEPVVVEVKLRNMEKRAKTVSTHIHPKYEIVKIGIKRPDGKIVNYENIGHYCLAEDNSELTEYNNTIYASAYIGYGKDGFYFDTPGIYKIKGAYQLEDGSIVQSDEVSIRVKSPLTEADDEIAELFMHDEAGVQFTLLGSDSPDLAVGLENLKTVSEKYPKHDLSVYADLVIGANNAGVFKTVDPDSKSVLVRDRNTPVADNHLKKVFEKSKGDDGIDNITLNWAYRQLATAYFREDDEKAAKSVLQKMTKCFADKKLKAPVLERIDHQAAMVMAEDNK